MMRIILTLLMFYLVPSCLEAQNFGTLLGTIRDEETQELLPGAIIRLEGSELGAAADLNGTFKIQNIPTKTWNVTASLLGYESMTKYNVVITSGNASQLNFELKPAFTELNEVTISLNRSTRIASNETPLSIQNLSVEEIKSNPGGNFDISRVVQVLPGVGGTSGNGSYRNDLIIRGGGPNENVYYLDGIEIPVINHFSTQGAAGGPTGILNVAFIEDATLSSSAFHARYDNPLSAVLQFKQRDGNSDRVQSNFRLSGTEAALTTEGPLGPRTQFLASARRSYLQFLFQALDLPIRPNYWDFQYKLSHRINAQWSITAIGIGAIDEFSFALPRETSAENLYVLSSNPKINQWNYTQGFTLKRVRNRSFWNLSFSRNMLDNRLDQFEDNYKGNQTDESKRILKINSQEIENKLRFEDHHLRGLWKWSYGASIQYAKYSNDVFLRGRPEIRDSSGQVIQNAVFLQFNTKIDLIKYGLFAQVSRRFLSDKLSLSAGIRSDANTFSNASIKNLWNTMSPRFSASYELHPQWKLNASIGTYYKILPYTVLGFQDENKNLINRDLPYTHCDHYVAGLEYIPQATLRFTLEGFYKNYSDYPVSVKDGISLANQGGDFGIIGNEAIRASGTGRTYGIELFAQQKLNRNLYFTGAYTLFWSEFAGTDGKLIRSAWDNRHLLSLLAGYKFKKNWELGLKYRIQGGSPYTPFDFMRSRVNYLVEGRGSLDYSRLNAEELRSFSQLDVRIDKKWNWKRLSLDIFLDLQNLLLNNNPGFPAYTFKRFEDNSGFETTDGQPIQLNGSNAIPILLQESNARILPTLGLVIEF